MLYIREMVVTSFEFFACRCLPDSKPIYCEDDYDKISNMVKTVLKSVENCCKKLETFRELFQEKQNISIEEFLSLPFHATTKNGNTQLYEERIIFSHISYLELFRRSKIEGEMDKGKIQINKLIVDTIIAYLNLYNTYIAKIDSQRKEVAKTLTDRAEEIKQKNYEDNEIKIQN